MEAFYDARVPQEIVMSLPELLEAIASFCDPPTRFVLAFTRARYYERYRACHASVYDGGEGFVVDAFQHGHTALAQWALNERCCSLVDLVASDDEGTPIASGKIALWETLLLHGCHNHIEPVLVARPYLHADLFHFLAFVPTPSLPYDTFQWLCKRFDSRHNVDSFGASPVRCVEDSALSF